MSRVHDKADKSVSGKWVGRSLELVEKPTAAAAAEMVGATMITQ